MQSRVQRELADADAVLFVVNGEQGIGPGDRFISRAMLSVSEDAARPPVACAVNKCDRLDPGEVAAALADAAELGAVDDVFPVSARTGDGLEALAEHLATLVPEGPFLYEPAARTDRPSDVHLAELIREQVLRRTREEIPHAVEVVVEGPIAREDGIVELSAQIWVEEDSQKGILIGKGGRMVREIGTAARKELEHEIGAQVFLDLEVRVRDRWRRDERALDQLGID
jgi:GTP-binding protein Era